MGFFNFHKKTELLAPMTGRVIPLEKVPDAVFSQKTLGEGAAIMPEDGLVTVRLPMSRIRNMRLP